MTFSNALNDLDLNAFNSFSYTSNGHCKVIFSNGLFSQSVLMLSKRVHNALRRHNLTGSKQSTHSTSNLIGLSNTHPNRQSHKPTRIHTLLRPLTHELLFFFKIAQKRENSKARMTVLWVLADIV